MAENLPGPYEIEYSLIGWTSPTRGHAMRISCAAVGDPEPGEPAADIDIQTAGGGTLKLQVVADQFWAFVRPFFHSSITASEFVLWRYVPGTLAKDFVSSGNLTTPAGINGGTPIAAQQLTFTWRAALGGIVKVVMLESSVAGDQSLTLIPNAAGTAQQKLAAYLLSTDNPVLARDDSYPVGALRESRGQNERVWRKIFRS